MAMKTIYKRSFSKCFKYTVYVRFNDKCFQNIINEHNNVSIIMGPEVKVNIFKVAHE